MQQRQLDNKCVPCRNAFKCLSEWTELQWAVSCGLGMEGADSAAVQAAQRLANRKSRRDRKESVVAQVETAARIVTPNRSNVAVNKVQLALNRLIDFSNYRMIAILDQSRRSFFDNFRL
jgi:hypothetical protein